MAKQRRRKEDNRSLIEKHEDAIAKFALYRDDVNHGRNSWLSGRGLLKLILTATLVVTVFVFFYSFAGMFFRW